MRMVAAVLTLVGLGLTVGAANAAGQGSRLAADKYQITAEEQTACASDAISLCSSAYPDEDKLLACMKVNRPNLSAACRPIFDEGLRRRHLN